MPKSKQTRSKVVKKNIHRDIKERKFAKALACLWVAINVAKSNNEHIQIMDSINETIDGSSLKMWESTSLILGKSTLEIALKRFSLLIQDMDLPESSLVNRNKKILLMKKKGYDQKAIQLWLGVPLSTVKNVLRIGKLKTDYNIKKKF